MIIKNNVLKKLRTKIIKVNKNDNSSDNDYSKTKLKKIKYKTQEMKSHIIINTSKDLNSKYIMNKNNKKLELLNKETVNPDDKNKENPKNIIDFPLITINLNKKIRMFIFQQTPIEY